MFPKHRLCHGIVVIASTLVVAVAHARSGSDVPGTEAGDLMRPGTEDL